MAGQGKRRTSGPDLSREDLLRMFSYDPATGEVTRLMDWSRWKNCYVDCTPRVVGGSRKCGGRRTVCINRERYTLTHLIWYLVTGDWPNELDEIDHQDHDPMNDRWSNLRMTNHSGNMMNRRKFKGQFASKYIGLKKMSNGWLARVRDPKGKTHAVGLFPLDAEDTAARARDLAAVRLCGDGVYLNFPEEHREKRSGTTRP